MADFQAITQSIRAYARSGIKEQTEELGDLAAGYAAHCRDANTRVRHCLEYIRRGCRTEVSHLANCQPNLLQLVATLQFEELKEWRATCSKFKLPQPAILDGIDRVAAAIKQEAKLMPLLAHHRLLALNRSPVHERLAIVRLLSKHDSTNSLWQTEASELETRRLPEIRAEIVNATKDGNGELLIDLWAELNDHPWQIGVPEELKESLQLIEQERKQAELVAEIEALTPRLMGLDASVSAEKAGALISRWRELEPAASKIVDAQTFSHVRDSIDSWQQAEASARNEPPTAPAGSVLVPDQNTIPAAKGRRWLWKLFSRST